MASEILKQNWELKISSDQSGTLKWGRTASLNTAETTERRDPYKGKQQSDLSPKKLGKHRNIMVLEKMLNIDGLSYRECARKLSVSSKTIIKWAKIYGFKSNHRQGWPKINRKYSVNDKYFDIIDSEDKAYFLGLMLSDGCVYKPRRSKSSSYKVTLASTDRDIIDKFILSIEYTGKPFILDKNAKIKGQRECYCVSFPSNYMAESLYRIGVTPRKSMTVKYPLINRDLERHMIRGIIDGDGHIRKNCIELTMGSKIFLETMSRRITDLFSIKPKEVSTIRDRYFKLYYPQKSMIKILKNIYLESNWYIDRKYNTAINVLKNQKIDRKIAEELSSPEMVVT